MSCLIKAKGLNKSFGEKIALSNVSFEIHSGAPVALVGPNGAGKTTLFSILCGYIQPTSGDVSIFGHEPGHVSSLSKLGALPQDAQLDPRFSIAKQLEFYAQLQGMSRKDATKEAHRTLELVQLRDAYNEKPMALSHGMRKRVTIAQSLIGSPSVVMLDEATAGLDPLHAREVRELVASLSSDITFILSSHDLSELERLCSTVLFLENGHLQQHNAFESDQSLGFITLRMAENYPEFITKLMNIEHVIEVKPSQDKEFVVSYSLESEQAIDIDILTMCYKNKWQYKQLINGKTLENQLFS
jgi:ABC-2 type transport system ATP-binding protein